MPKMSPAAPAAAPRTSARERLLAAADELFYREGINNVGIDRVIDHAGVAKASLYSNFGSKDELVRAYLQGKHSARQQRVLDRIARHRSPRERLLSVFDGLAEMSALPSYRGCAFVRGGRLGGAKDRGAAPPHQHRHQQDHSLEHVDYLSERSKT